MSTIATTLLDLPAQLSTDADTSPALEVEHVSHTDRERKTTDQITVDIRL